MIPLTLVGIGNSGKIKRVGGTTETRRFLANLGFVEEAVVTVNAANGDNLIVNIKDSRIAINGDMAKHILVSISE